MRRKRTPRDIGALLRMRDPETIELVRATLEKHDGSVPDAASELACTPPALWRWLRATPELRKVKRRGRGRPTHD